MTRYPWKPPRIWEGQTAYIIGGGPSVNNQDLSLIHDKHVIGVNNSYLLGNWVDCCWWGDMKWLMWHRTRLLTIYHSLVASCNTNNKVIDRNKSWIKFFRRGKATGIDPKPGFVSWNRNSGCSAINFAYHLGATRIILLGFDMTNGLKGETHWHGGHSKESKNQKKRKAPYERFRKTCEFIRRDARKKGIKILNVSDITTITSFPIVKLEDTL